MSALERPRVGREGIGQDKSALAELCGGTHGNPAHTALDPCSAFRRTGSENLFFKANNQYGAEKKKKDIKSLLGLKHVAAQGLPTLC